MISASVSPVAGFLTVTTADALSGSVTAVTPSGKTEPEAGVQLASKSPLTVSLAVAVKLTAAPAGPVASATRSIGRLSSGAVVSTTLTVNVPDVALPVGKHVDVIWSCHSPSSAISVSPGTS